MNLTTSETKQFCEASSFSEVKDIKNEEFCETSFKNGKLSAELTASYQCVLRFFQSTCLKYCACHGKLMPGHTKCCACHAKSSWQTCTSDTPKCNPSQEISAPDFLTSLMNMSFVLCLPRKCIFADPLQMSHACHHSWKFYKTLTFWSLLTRCTNPCACHAKRHLSKSGANLWCFAHFDFEMCFAPQRRTPFQHRDVQKWSERGVFCTF